jgi:hypothetical protein
MRIVVTLVRSLVVLLIPACSLFLPLDAERTTDEVNLDAKAETGTAPPMDATTVETDAPRADDGGPGEAAVGCPLQNQLLNGAFEFGASGWLTSKATLELVPGRSGKGARICALANQSNYFVDTNFSPAIAGKRFAYVAWVKRDGAALSQRLVMQVEDTLVGDTGAIDIRPASETQWKCFQQMVDTSAGINDFNFAGDTGPDDACVVVDDVQLMVLPAGTSPPPGCGCP